MWPLTSCSSASFRPDAKPTGRASPVSVLHTPCNALRTPCIRDEPFRSAGRLNAMNQFTQSTDRTNTLRGIPVSVCAATEQINAT